MITLKQVVEITAKKKNTTAVFFQDLKVGDKLKIEIDLSSSYGAKQARVTNLNTGATRKDYLGSMQSRMDCFEFTEML